MEKRINKSPEAYEDVCCHICELKQSHIERVRKIGYEGVDFPIGGMTPAFDYAGNVVHICDHCREAIADEMFGTLTGDLVKPAFSLGYKHRYINYKKFVKGLYCKIRQKHEDLKYDYEHMQYVENRINGAIKDIMKQCSDNKKMVPSYDDVASMFKQLGNDQCFWNTYGLHNICLETEVTLETSDDQNRVDEFIGYLCEELHYNKEEILSSMKDQYDFEVLSILIEPQCQFFEPFMIKRLLIGKEKDKQKTGIDLFKGLNVTGGFDIK